MKSKYLTVVQFKKPGKMAPWATLSLIYLVLYGVYRMSTNPHSPPSQLLEILQIASGLCLLFTNMVAHECEEPDGLGYSVFTIHGILNITIVVAGAFIVYELAKPGEQSYFAFEAFSLTAALLLGVSIFLLDQIRRD